MTSRSNDEESLRIALEDDASSPATTAADALERLQHVLENLEGQGAEKYFANLKGGAEGAAKEFRRLGEIGKSAGSALAAGMTGTLNRMVAATQGTVKLSSALELATKRANALKAAEDRAFSEAMIRANRTPTELQSSPGEVSKFRQVVGLVGRVFGQGAAGKLTEGAAYLARATDNLGPGSEALLAGGKMLAVGAAAGVAAAAALTLAGAFLAAKLLHAGAELAVQASSYRREQETTLARLLGGAKAARETYDIAIRLAGDLNLEKETALQRVRALFTAGLRGKTIEVAIEAVADWSAVRGEESANALQKALEKTKAKEKFGTEAIDSLAEAGIRSEDVYRHLAKVLGTDVPTAMSKVKAGLVDTDKGIEAILATVNDQAGGAARAKAKEIDGLVNKLKLQFEGLFDSVDVEPLKEFLGSISTLLGGPQGAALKGEVSNLFGTLFKTLFGPFQGEQGKKRLEQFMQGLILYLNGATKFIAAAGPPFVAFVDLVLRLLDLISGGKSKGQSSSGGFLSSILGGVDFFTQAKTIGKSIVDGLIAGVTSGAQGFLAACVSVVSGGLSGMKGPKGADAHSPSRKTAQIGDFMVDGLLVRLQGGRDRAATAGEALAARAVGGTARAANDNAITPASRRTAESGNVTIPVTVVAPPGMTRAEAEGIGDAVGGAAYRAWRRHMGMYLDDLEKEAA